jgi:hypothetical protein
MNTDIRISVSFRDHRKRKKLRLMLGPGSAEYLLDLWISTAMNHPSGVLAGMDALDIALEAGWEGDPETFISALMRCGFLDRAEDGVYSLHDWEDHQSYVVHAPDRIARAKKGAEARWEGKRRGKRKDARGIQEKCPENALSIQGAMLNSEISNAPAPSPVPSPTPSPVPAPKESLKDTSVLTAAGEPDPKPQTAAPPTAADVIRIWNRRLTPLGFPSVRKTTPERERHFGARVRDAEERRPLAWWEGLMARMERSSFLRDAARKNAPWLSFDWILNESNLVKVAEGKYCDRPPPPVGPEWRDGTPEEIEAERRRQELRDAGFRGDPDSPGDLAAWGRHLARARAAEGGASSVGTAGGD